MSKSTTAVPEHDNTAAMFEVPDLFKGTGIFRTVALRLCFSGTSQTT